jgi:signal transduction histidine kinase
MLKNINKNYVLIKSQIVYIGIGIIIIAIIMSLYFSKIISRPINSINDKARALANGNYDIKFEHNGIKEVDELSDTLNYLESEVSKTDKYRRDLMANVSHDLKTPLTMIKAYAEMVRDITYDNKEKREDNLNIIIDETDRLNILVGDILELSKLQASSEVLEIEEFDLNKEIKGILKRYDYLKETEKYNIKAIMPKEIMVKGDKKRIDQVIYNLINNAINYTGEDKTVTLKVTENKNDYLIEIIDTGKGIKKEDLPYIWDKYYKNDKNHSRNVVGTGLGLSIVKNILEQHGFEYGVNSKRGKGSTFYFMVNKSSKK